MDYAVGDRVRIREDLIGYDTYPYNNGRSHLLCSKHMCKYCGMEAEITSRVVAGEDRFRLDVDEGYWQWCSSMLEPCEDQNTYDPLDMDFLKEVTTDGERV